MRNRRNKPKGIFFSLLDIYWPLLLFGGVQVCYILVKDPGRLLPMLLRPFRHPGQHLLLLGLMSLLTVGTLTLILMMAFIRPEPDSEPASVQEDNGERFPGLNYRLRPTGRGMPQLVQKVIIPHTLPASTVCSEPRRLRLMLGEEQKLSVPLIPGEHTVQAEGCTIRLTVIRESGTEDITRELSLPH